MGIQWTTILELIVHNRQTRIPLGAITGYLPAARDKLGYRALDAAVDCCGSDVSGRDFCTHRVHMALLAHLALAFSVPLLPHPRHSPAVPAGCRAGRPALGPRPAAPLGRTQVIAYHKPAGLIVTHNDELDRPTVYEHLAQQPGFPEGRWDAVGRLDLNTSGLLLLTNDGWLLRHVTDPTSGTTRLPKTYRILASKVLGEAVLEQLRCGVELGGGLGRSGAAEVTLLGHGKGSTRLLLTIREGKNRQVRRMLHAVGSAVVRLERESIGTLGLGSLGSEEGGGDTQPPLPVGAWRMLDEEEVRLHLEYEPRDLTPSRRAAPTPPPPPPPPPLTTTATTAAATATTTTTTTTTTTGQYLEGQYPEGQYLLLDSGDQARLEPMPCLLTTMPTCHPTSLRPYLLATLPTYYTILATRRGSRYSTAECWCGPAPRPRGARAWEQRRGAGRP